MCLITLSWRQHHHYPLVLSANRDEYFARPTEALHRWADHPRVIAGRDLQAGGTWMGLGLDQAKPGSGRFAALTNIREGNAAGHTPANLRSRGELVADFLRADLSALDYAHQCTPHLNDYNGFNLLLGDAENLVYCNNRGHNVQILAPGLYSLSNATLNTPWPKTRLAAAQLQYWLEHDPSAESIESLASLLNSRELAEPDELPNTGIDPSLELALSAQFIALEHYGTRSSSALLIDHHGHARLHEITFGASEGASSEDYKLPNFWPHQV